VGGANVPLKRDRRQLSLLHQILKAVSDDEYEVEYHDKRVEVLENGFTGEYADEFAPIYDELSLDQCRLAWDILDMFTVIHASVNDVGIERVKAVEKHAEFALRFRGSTSATGLRAVSQAMPST